MEPGETFTKVWRIRNDGTCTWKSDYIWEQVNLGNTKLTATNPQLPLNTAVAPGESFVVSVEMTLAADANAGSKQIARFQMRTPQGKSFGTRPFALIFAGSGSGTCPVGDAEQITHINFADRYCFLYPKNYEAYLGSTGHTIVRQPNTPGVIEEILALVSISNEGGTGGLNLNQWTSQVVEEWKVPGSTPLIENIKIGGLAARQTDDLPGMVGNRTVFLLNLGEGFILNIMPIDDAFPQKKGDALDLWEMVQTSFRFFGP